MNAAAVAKRLALAGVHIERTEEGDETEDGAVHITPLVHVQVPTFAGCPGVVAETGDGAFRFFPPRKTYTALIIDIREALGLRLPCEEY